jgi:predicted anti-sigma-YlaC factor YlaD
MTDKRHPEQLLAGYVDGSLTDRDRRAVESHLSTCARCRQESALAMRGLGALRELADEPVPVGVMNPVNEEIARRMSRPPRPLSQRVLWAAGGAVAAAFIGVLAVWVLPNVGGGAADMAGGVAAPEAAASGTRGPSTTGGEGVAGALAPIGMEHTSTNYDDTALRSLASATARDAAAGTLGASDTPGSEPAETATATECLAKGASVEPQDVLVRLISARYRGEPALIGVYLSGPAPGRTADEVVVWVVRPQTCEFASITSKRI